MLAKSTIIESKGSENQEKTRKCLPFFKTILMKVCLARIIKFGFFAPKRTNKIRRRSEKELKKTLFRKVDNVPPSSVENRKI